MSDNPWHRSITIPASALEPDPGFADVLDSVRKMGQQSRLYLWWMARKAGADVLPGYRIYVQGVPHDVPDQDLGIMEPGEAEYAQERELAELRKP